MSLSSYAASLDGAERTNRIVLKSELRSKRNPGRLSRTKIGSLNPLNGNSSAVVDIDKEFVKHQKRRND